MDANRWAYWTKQLLSGTLALFSVLFVYYILLALNSFRGYAPFSCYTNSTPAYVEEVNIVLFGIIGLVWLLFFRETTSKLFWLRVVKYCSLLVVALILSFSIYTLTLRVPFYEEFDGSNWQISKEQFSTAMARKLVHDNTLVGMSKDEVEAMLGKSANSSYYDYYLDVGLLALYIKYDSSTVEEAVLVCID